MAGPHSSLTTYGMVLAVGPNSRHKTLPDLLAFAKANPKAVSYSSVGVGTAHHLLGADRHDDRHRHLRCAAVKAGENADLPGVPTLSSMIPGMEYESWIGLTGPKGMPADLVQQLNQDLREIVNMPDVRQRFLDMGAAPRVSSPDEFRQLAERDIAQWRKVVDGRNILRE